MMFLMFALLFACFYAFIRKTEGGYLIKYATIAICGIFVLLEAFYFFEVATVHNYATTGTALTYMLDSASIPYSATNLSGNASGSVSDISSIDGMYFITTETLTNPRLDFKAVYQNVSAVSRIKIYGYQGNETTFYFIPEFVNSTGAVNESPELIGGNYESLNAVDGNTYSIKEMPLGNGFAFNASYVVPTTGFVSMAAYANSNNTAYIQVYDSGLAAWTTILTINGGGYAWYNYSFPKYYSNYVTSNTAYLRVYADSGNRFSNIVHDGLTQPNSSMWNYSTDKLGPNNNYTYENGLLELKQNVTDAVSESNASVLIESNWVYEISDDINYTVNVAIKNTTLEVPNGNISVFQALMLDDTSSSASGCVIAFNSTGYFLLAGEFHNLFVSDITQIYSYSDGYLETYYNRSDGNVTCRFSGVTVSHDANITETGFKLLVGNQITSLTGGNVYTGNVSINLTNFTMYMNRLNNSGVNVDFMALVTNTLAESPVANKEYLVYLRNMTGLEFIGYMQSGTNPQEFILSGNTNRYILSGKTEVRIISVNNAYDGRSLFVDYIDIGNYENKTAYGPTDENTGFVLTTIKTDYQVMALIVQYLPFLFGFFIILVIFHYAMLFNNSLTGKKGDKNSPL